MISDPTLSVPLSEYVVKSLNKYFEQLEGELPKDLYHLVIQEVEKGFFKVIMDKSGGNQCLASKMAGLARNTLRKKIKEYDLDELACNV